MTKSDTKRLFALSIDESIEWAAIDTDETSAKRNVHSWGTIELPPLPRDGTYALHSLLAEALGSLREKSPGALDKPDAIGVSAIGTISDFKLKSIHRKRWAPRTNYPDTIVNFKDLFSEVFKVKSASLPLRVENDATAKAQAEVREHHYKRRENEYAPSPFIYITIDEGMNCGLLFSLGGFDAVLHPNIGHSFPPPHKLDKFIDEAHSGCPAHANCYEGLASFARFRNRWKKYDLNDFGLDHPQWKIQAHYVSQACLTLSYIIRPRLIVVGGCIATPSLIHDVHHLFDDIGSVYLSHAGLKVDSLIKLAVIDSSVVPIQGAIAVASMALSGAKKVVYLDRHGK